MKIIIIRETDSNIFSELVPASEPLHSFPIQDPTIPAIPRPYQSNVSYLSSTYRYIYIYIYVLAINNILAFEISGRGRE